MATMPVALLDRELYTVGEAARLLRVPKRTLMNWLDGNTMRGIHYPPVIRADGSGGDLLTWGEFVEAAFLTEYRRVRDVPLQHLRPVIDDLRERYGVPYPLAHYRPLVIDRELVIGLLDEADEPSTGPPKVVHRTGQLLLGNAFDAFLDKVEFDDNVARRLHPEGKESPVMIDPEVAFGIPVVRAVRTEVIHELFDAGESVDFIAETYELTKPAVEAAIRFETRREPRTTGAAA